jgi:ABC-type multidrug transport system fused ATPase/permease subunit
MAELHLKRRLLGYSKTLLPLFAEMYSVFRFRVLLVIVSSLLAVGFELGGLSFIYLLFKSGDRGLSLLGVHMTPQGGWLLLPLLLLAGAALMYFLYNSNVIRLANLVAEYSLLQMHRGLRTISAWPQDENTRDFATMRKLIRIQGNALMVHARVSRLLNYLWAPGLLFLGGYCILFSINPWLGVVITVVLLALLCAQAVVSLKSARNSSRWENVNPKVFGFLREDLKRRLSVNDTPDSEDALKRMANNLLSALQDRLLVLTYSQLMVSIALIAALCLVFLNIRPQAELLSQDSSLPSMVAVLAIIIRMFMSLRGLAGRVTNINRFYPQLNRYARLRRILEHRASSVAVGKQAIQSTTILTDLPDNRLNRLRWQFLLFGGQNVDFDGKGAGPRISIISALPNSSQEKYIWVDFDKMRNDPPVLCRPDEVPALLDRFQISTGAEKQESRDAVEEDEDFE